MNTRGFTLIELLVSVAIVGVLASIALPAFKDYKTRAYHMVARQQLNDARTALESYLVDEDAVPLFFDIRADGTPSTSAVADTFPGFTHQKGVVISFSINTVATAGDGSIDLAYNIEALHCKGPIGNSEEEGDSLTSWVASGNRLPFEFSSSGFKPEQAICAY